MAAVDPRPPLVRLFHQWNARAQSLVARDAMPLLRLEHGAALVREPRVARIEALVAALLAVAVPRLFIAERARASGSVRPKLRLSLSLTGAGLVARVSYFGVAPTDAETRAALAPLGEAVCAFPPRAARPDRPSGEVVLEAAWAEAPARIMLVRVLAGARPVAVPLGAIARATTEDLLDEPLEQTHSLAEMLGEEPVPATQGRPAVLLLRGRGQPVGIRVETLREHGVGQVRSAGPVLSALPWLLGVCADGDAAPELVVDPAALLRATAERDPGC